MLNKLGLSFHGNLHCGLDDATNIGRIAIELIKVMNYLYEEIWLFTVKFIGFLHYRMAVC